MGMLKVSTLEDQLKQCFKETLPDAFEQALLATFPNKTKAGDDAAKKFSEILDDMLSETLAQRIAAAIDYYVKSITLQGTIITTGSPFMQMAKIMPVNIANPTAGLVPNTIGLGGMYE